MGRCPGTISKCWPGICHGAVMSKVMLPQNSQYYVFFVTLEESRRAIPDGRQGIVAVLSRGAWLKTPADHVSILHIREMVAEKAELSTGIFTNEESEDSDVDVVWERVIPVNSHDARHAYVMRVGDWQMWTYIPHWPREATLRLTRCGISTLTQSEAINWVVSLM